MAGSQWMTVEEMKQNLEDALNPGLMGLEPVKFFTQIEEGK